MLSVAQKKPFSQTSRNLIAALKPQGKYRVVLLRERKKVIVAGELVGEEETGER